MKKSLLVLSVLTLSLSLASCNPDKAPEFSKEDATKLVEGFSKELNTTVKATYIADYALTVDSDNAGAKGFEQTIKDKTTIEADFTADNLYLYVSKTGKDAKKETEDKTTEALVYKDGDTYKYLTSDSAEATSLENEEKALEKISELLETTSKRNAGYINKDSFIFSGIDEYIHREFLLNSTNVTIDIMENNYTFENKDEGLHLTADAKYIGYLTDGGTSELSNDPGATIDLTTNKDGLVLNYTETYKDATLEMPIMTPSPILHLNGTRSLTSSYGETLTKKNTIKHEVKNGTVKLNELDSTKGTYQVMTCAPQDFKNMQKVEDGGEVKVGNWICIKVTPTEEYKSSTVTVTVNQNSKPMVDPAQAGGFYVYTAVEGENAITVNLQ